MADETTMSDEALDNLLDNTFTQEDGSTGFVNEETSSDNGSGDTTDVSPSDDIDAGQTEEEEEITHVDETSELDEDPEDGLSPDNEEGEVEEEEADTEDDESDEGNLEAEDESDLESEAEHVAFQPLRADGKEYPIESMEELYSLASKGINSDRKWQESAKGRKIASTLEANNLTEADINMLVDLKKGDMNAITSLLKEAKIDPLDIDADALDGNTYVPKDYGTSDIEMRLNDTIQKVKGNPRYQESVNVIMEQWDEQSKAKFYERPEMLEALNIDMQPDETGVSLYDRVNPVAEKMKAMETGTIKSDLEYYVMAGRKVTEALQASSNSKKDIETKKKMREQTKKTVINKKKKAAASSGGTRTTAKAIDVTTMSDSDLDKLLEETS